MRRLLVTLLKLTVIAVILAFVLIGFIREVVDERRKKTRHT